MFKKSFIEECNRFLKEKMMVLVLFIIPILLVILMGFEMSREVIDNIPMAVIDHDQSTFSRQLFDAFNQNETFNVSQYPSSEQELENLMKNSKVRVGLIIPENFYNDIVALKSPTVLMLYDGSHMSMTSVTKSKATEILLTYKAGATINQLRTRLGLSYEEAYNVAQPVQINDRMLYNPSKSFEDFLAIILMAALIQTAIVLMASVSINHGIFDKERKERIGYASGKVLFYTLCGSLSFIICIIIQASIFGMPFRGLFLVAFIISIALSFAVSAFCVLVSALIKNQMLTLVGCSIIFIPNSIMAGTTWPNFMMPLGYQGYAKFVPFPHYVNNLRNIYLKGLTLRQVTPDIVYMFLFGVVSLMVVEFVIVILEKKDVNREGKRHDISRDVQNTVQLDI
ncbi:ABC transporter permease [Clostridium sediminicola]|uniref:ABC transporter permease n=1 Tax=Clostridium sediminicola TaxID=3114879 RepID=UPI0031F25DDF